MKIPKVSSVYKGEKLRKRSREDALMEAGHKKAMVMTESSCNFNKYGHNGNRNVAGGMAMMTKMSNFGQKPSDRTEAKMEVGRNKTGLTGEIETGKDSGVTEKAVMDINEEAAMVWDDWEVSDMEIREGHSSGLMEETMELGGILNQYWAHQEFTWNTPEDKDIAWEGDIWKFPKLPKS